MTTETQAEPSPYAQAAETYWRNGWGALPLPHKAKSPPPKDWTGADAPYPSWPDVIAWMDDSSSGNIALRMPPTVVGIDVDNYGQKRGGSTLYDMQRRYGDLPPTYTSTARSGERPMVASEHSMSGIRFYRVPEGLAWPGIAGPDIEVIQARHRYAVVWPSVHPDLSSLYRWYDPQGNPCVVPPSVDDLPLMPSAWIDGLTGMRAAKDIPRADEAAGALWAAHPHHSEPPCARMRTAVAKACAELAAQTPGSRHEIAMVATASVAHLAVEGHTGMRYAFVAIGQAFSAAIGHDVSRAGEWQRIANGALLIAAARAQATVDPCTQPFGRIGAAPRAPLTASQPLPGVTGTPEQGPAGRIDPVASPGHRNPFGSGDSLPQAAQQRVSDDPMHSGVVPVYTPSEPVQPVVVDWTPTAEQIAAEAEAQSYAAEMRMRAQDIARRRIKATYGNVRPTVETMADLVQRDLPPQRYLIDQLWGAGERVMLAAQRKAGKTSLVLDLLHCLADGEKFLGQYDVAMPAGNIALLDFEMTESKLQSWVQRMKLQHPERVLLLRFRGNASAFDVMDDKTRAEWAAELKRNNVSVLIIDCLRPIIDALGMDESHDAGQLLDKIDMLVHDAGVTEYMVVHHMGHEGERSRGDSRLRDWPDMEWFIKREQAKNGEELPIDCARFISVEGRDDPLESTQILLDKHTGRVVLGTLSRKEVKRSKDVNAHLAAVTQFLDENGESSLKDIQDGTALNEHYVRSALNAGIERRTIRVRIEGKASKKLYSLAVITHDEEDAEE